MSYLDGFEVKDSALEALEDLSQIGIPHDSHALIDLLNKSYSTINPTIEEISTEQGRINIAMRIGQRELVDLLIQIRDRPAE